MNKNINCTFNSKGAWCINKKIKRSLFGFGARCCIEYYGNEKCPLKEMFPKPEIKKPGGIKSNK